MCALCAVGARHLYNAGTHVCFVCGACMHMCVISVGRGTRTHVFIMCGKACTHMCTVWWGPAPVGGCSATWWGLCVRVQLQSPSRPADVLVPKARSQAGMKALPRPAVLGFFLEGRGVDGGPVVSGGGLGGGLGT